MPERMCVSDVACGFGENVWRWTSISCSHIHYYWNVWGR